MGMTMIELHNGGGYMLIFVIILVCSNFSCGYSMEIKDSTGTRPKQIAVMRQVPEKESAVLSPHEECVPMSVFHFMYESLCSQGVGGRTLSYCEHKEPGFEIKYDTWLACHPNKTKPLNRSV
jgi:hypothetical protein